MERVAGHVLDQSGGRPAAPGEMRPHHVWGGCMMAPADAEIAFRTGIAAPISVSRCTWRGGAGSYRRSAGSYRRIDQNSLVFVFVDDGEVENVPRARWPVLHGGQFALLGSMSGIFTAIRPHSGCDCIIMSVIVPGYMLLPRLAGGISPGATFCSREGQGAVAKHCAASLCDGGTALDAMTIRRLNELLVESLAACIMQRATVRDDGGVMDRRFGQVSDYLDRNFHRTGISAHALAAELGISDRYLTMVLANRGTSFPALLRERRVTEARRLLTAPALARCSIADIAGMVGFADPAYFSHVFKSVTGETPGRFRDRAKGKDRLVKL